MQLPVTDATINNEERDTRKRNDFNGMWWISGNRRISLYANVSNTISESVPTRIGGPHVPAPLDVYTCISPNRCNP